VGPDSPLDDTGGGNQSEDRWSSISTGANAMNPTKRLTDDRAAAVVNCQNHLHISAETS
jgi:hypothetical protein